MGGVKTTDGQDRSSGLKADSTWPYSVLCTTSSSPSSSNGHADNVLGQGLPARQPVLLPKRARVRGPKRRRTVPISELLKL